MTDFTELLDRWNSDEGKPYKGRLIDWSSYQGDGDEPPADIGCMCAQGQALHLLGGWSPRRLREATQAKADLATAELFNISVAHAILLRSVNDQTDGAPAIVITHPERVLGEGAAGILAFWRHLDAMTTEDWRDAWAARDARDAWAARDARAARAARDAWAAWATRDAWAARAARDAWDAWDARDAWDAWDARDAWAVVYAALAEIGGARWLAEHDKGEFVFLPMFGFASPDALPPLPADYGRPSNKGTNHG